MVKVSIFWLESSKRLQYPFCGGCTGEILKIHAREVSFAGQKINMLLRNSGYALACRAKRCRSERLQLEGCRVLEYARHKRKLRLGALKVTPLPLGTTRSENRDDVEQRLIDICVKVYRTTSVPNVLGLAVATCRCAALGANQYPVRDRNKRSFGCRQPAVRCLIRLLLSASKKADVNQVVDGDALQLAGRGSWFVATTEELAELQRRVNDKVLMITAALPGSGEWGTQREALAFEQAAVAEETELQTLLVRES